MSKVRTSRSWRADAEEMASFCSSSQTHGYFPMHERVSCNKRPGASVCQYGSPQTAMSWDGRVGCSSQWHYLASKPKYMDQTMTPTQAMGAGNYSKSNKSTTPTLEEATVMYPENQSNRASLHKGAHSADRLAKPLVATFKIL